MTRTHHAVVEDQFGPRANAYVTSAVHAGGEDLDALEAIVARAAPSHAIDLGAGAGMSPIGWRHTPRPSPPATSRPR